METTGEEHLCSNKARELFEHGKEWITKQWEGKGKEVTSMAILPKTIGRNKGFIVDVFVAGQEKRARYDAKMQAIQIDTVMMHHLLKLTKCGPEEFLIVLLTCEEEDCFWYSVQHGVITGEAENCVMAADWTESDEERIRSSEQLFRTESFLLTFLVAMGSFCRVPVNRANWGLTNWEAKTNGDARYGAPCLMIVDFSSGESDSCLTSPTDFLGDWIAKTILMYNVIDVKDRDARTAYITKFVTDTSVWQEAWEIPWMHSQQTLLHLLQQVCTDTELWIVDTIQKVTDGAGTTFTTDAASAQQDEAVFPLRAFRYIARSRSEVLHQSNNAYKVWRLITEYESWLSVWNEQLTALFEWFPFPASLLTTVPAVPVAEGATEPVATVGAEAEVKAEAVRSVEPTAIHTTTE